MESVSVIIPTYNRDRIITRALDSVIAQTYPVAEVIVVDDGSTDSTEKLIRASYSKVDYLKQSNQGVSAARNLGIKSSSANWLAFLDSDDEWLPGKLKRQFAALSEKPEFKLIHSNEVWIRKGVRVNPMGKHEKFGGYIFDKCLPRCVISPSSVIVHRDIFDSLGLFDESLLACEDYDLWLRICSKYPVLYLDENLVRKYGGHEDQLSRKYWGMDRFRIAALHKILKSGDLNKEQINSVQQVLIEKCQILINGANKRGNEEVKAYVIKILSTHF